MPISKGNTGSNNGSENEDEKEMNKDYFKQDQQSKPAKCFPNGKETLKFDEFLGVIRDSCSEAN